MTTFIFALAILFNAAANIFVKIGALKAKGALGAPMQIHQLFSFLNAYLICGLFFFAAALSLYSYVLSHINLSIAYPIMSGTGFVLVILFSTFFLRESFGIAQAIGCAMIIGGCWLVTRV